MAKPCNGAMVVEVRHAPGRPSHVVFVNHEAQWVLGGACFQSSVGRTDLRDAIRQTWRKASRPAFSLPDDVVVCLAMATQPPLGERTSNPFVNGRDQAFCKVKLKVDPSRGVLHADGLVVGFGMA